MENRKKKEAKYLIQLLKSTLLSIQPPEKPEDIEFKDIYVLSKKHFVSNMIYQGVSKLKSKPSEELLKAWKNEYFLGKMRNTVQKQELDIILEKFNENKIKNVPLKGFQIKEVYPAQDLRQMSDLDILIPLESRKRSKEILEKLGYESIEYGAGKDDVYYKKPIMNIEIHNDLFDESDKEMKKYFLHLSKMEKVVKQSEYTYTFSKEDTLIYGIIHLLKHFKNKGIGIRYIIDWWLYNRKYKEILDWEYINKSFKELNIEEFYKNIIYLGEVWFEGKPSNDKVELLEEYIINSGIYGVQSNHYINVLVKNSEGKIKGSKIKTLKKLIFPEPEVMIERYPILKNKGYLLSFYYIRRILEIVIYRRKGKLDIINEVVSKKDIQVEKQDKLYKKIGLK